MSFISEILGGQMFSEKSNCVSILSTCQEIHESKSRRGNQRDRRGIRADEGVNQARYSIT